MILSVHLFDRLDIFRVTRRKFLHVYVLFFGGSTLFPSLQHTPERLKPIHIERDIDIDIYSSVLYSYRLCSNSIQPASLPPAIDPIQYTETRMV